MARHFIDTQVNYVTLITHILWPGPQAFDNAKRAISRKWLFTAGSHAPPAPRAPSGRNRLADGTANGRRWCWAFLTRLDGDGKTRCRTSSPMNRAWNYVVPQVILASTSNPRHGNRSRRRLISRSMPNAGHVGIYRVICWARSSGELTFVSARSAGTTIRCVTTVSASARMLRSPLATRASMWPARSVR